MRVCVPHCVGKCVRVSLCACACLCALAVLQDYEHQDGRDSPQPYDDSSLQALLDFANKSSHGALVRPMGQCKALALLHAGSWELQSAWEVELSARAALAVPRPVTVSLHLPVMQSIQLGLLLCAFDTAAVCLPLLRMRHEVCCRPKPETLCPLYAPFLHCLPSPSSVPPLVPVSAHAPACGSHYQPSDREPAVHQLLKQMAGAVSYQPPAVAAIVGGTAGQVSRCLHSFIHSSYYWLVHSFVCSPVCSFTRLLVPTFIPVFLPHSTLTLSSFRVPPSHSLLPLLPNLRPSIRLPPSPYTLPFRLSPPPSIPSMVM